MAIRLFDSLTRQIRELKPSQPDGVFRMYCCGPTVYGPAHIGNFRTFLVRTCSAACWNWSSARTR